MAWQYGLAVVDRHLRARTLTLHVLESLLFYSHAELATDQLPRYYYQKPGQSPQIHQT